MQSVRWYDQHSIDILQTRLTRVRCGGYVSTKDRLLSALISLPLFIQIDTDRTDRMRDKSAGCDGVSGHVRNGTSGRRHRRFCQSHKTMPLVDAVH